MHFSFSIIIPVYNEIKIIEKFIDKLNKTFRHLNVKYIFIDDGSKDGSKKWLENFIQLPTNNYVEFNRKIDGISGATISVSSLKKNVFRLTNILKSELSIYGK